MTIKFSICYHDALNDLKKWEVFVEKFQEKLGLKIDFHFFSPLKMN